MPSGGLQLGSLDRTLNVPKCSRADFVAGGLDGGNRLVRADCYFL